MGVSGFQQRTGCVPFCANGLTVFQKIPHTVHEIIALHNDITPGGPNSRLVRKGQQITEGFSVFLVQQRITLLFHIVRTGSTLRIDIKHQKAVIAVGMCDSLHGLKGWIQSVRCCGRGIDSDADQRFLASCSEDISIFRIGIGNIQPFGYIVFCRRNQCSLQCWVKKFQLNLIRCALRNMHGICRLLLWFGVTVFFLR